VYTNTDESDPRRVKTHVSLEAEPEKPEQVMAKRTYAEDFMNMKVTPVFVCDEFCNECHVQIDADLHAAVARLKANYF
jgi:hypothetical protein